MPTPTKTALATTSLNIWSEFDRGCRLFNRETNETEWQDFVKPANKHYFDARCKYCQQIMAGRPERLKSHLIVNCSSCPVAIKQKWTESTKKQKPLLVLKQETLPVDPKGNADEMMIQLLDSQLSRHQKVLLKHQQELAQLELLFRKERKQCIQETELPYQTQITNQYHTAQSQSKCVLCTENDSTIKCTNCNNYSKCSRCEWPHKCQVCAGYCDLCEFDPEQHVAICECSICTNCSCYSKKCSKSHRDRLKRKLFMV